MEVIKYKLNGHEVIIPNSEEHRAIAQAEADDGKYTIVDDGVPEPEQTEEVTADDVLNALLGVTE